jgi:hypothetical protein
MNSLLKRNMKKTKAQKLADRFPSQLKDKIKLLFLNSYKFS